MNGLIYQKFTKLQFNILNTNISILTIFGILMSLYCSFYGLNTFSHVSGIIIPLIVLYNLYNFKVLFKQKDDTKMLTTNQGEYLFVNSAITCSVIMVVNFILLLGEFGKYSIFIKLLSVPLFAYVIYNTFIMIKTDIGQKI